MKSIITAGLIVLGFSTSVHADESGQDTPKRPVKMSCTPTHANVFTSTTQDTTSLTRFREIRETRVYFQQMVAGCAIVTFSAEAGTSSADTDLVIQAVLDGRQIAAPGSIFLASQIGLQARGFTFLFPFVPAGSHSIAIEFRRSGAAGQGAILNHTTFVQNQ